MASGSATPRGKGEPGRKGRSAPSRGRRRSATVLPWYLIVLGTAVAASTSVAQQRAVAVLSDTGGDNTDPLPT